MSVPPRTPYQALMTISILGAWAGRVVRGRVVLSTTILESLTFQPCSATSLHMPRMSRDPQRWRWRSAVLNALVLQCSTLNDDVMAGLVETMVTHSSRSCEDGPGKRMMASPPGVLPVQTSSTSMRCHRWTPRERVAHGTLYSANSCKPPAPGLNRAFLCIGRPGDHD